VSKDQAERRTRYLQEWLATIDPLYDALGPSSQSQATCLTGT